MKYFMIAFLLVMTLQAETICVTMPNGNIICTDEDGDNTYIYTTEKENTV